VCLKLLHAQRILPLHPKSSRSRSQKPRLPPANPHPRWHTQAQPCCAPESRVSPFEADAYRKTVDLERNVRFNRGAGAVPITSRRWRNRKAQAIREQSWTFAAELEKPARKSLAATLRKRTVVLQENELIVTVAQPASVLQFIMASPTASIPSAASTQQPAGAKGARCVTRSRSPS